MSRSESARRPDVHRRAARPAAGDDARPAAAGPVARVWQTTWAPALLGALLLWASFPPLDLGPLGWLATLPWLDLIRRPQLAGKRPYAVIFLSGLVFWLAAIYWLILPYPMGTSFGWFALSFYLALYVPLMVAISRGAVHRLHVPLAVVAPMAWVAAEFGRAHILGFSMVCLAHTQYRWLTVIQISDLAGAYGLSLVMVAVAACLLQGIVERGGRRWLSLGAAVGLFAVTLGYGARQLSTDHALPGPRVGIVQRCIRQSLTEGQAPAGEVMNKHIEYSMIAAQQNPDVILWPESMWRYPLAEIEPGATPPESDWSMEDLQKAREWYAAQLERLAKYIGKPLVLGIEFHVFGQGRPRRFNSAVLLTADGQIAGRYHKNHRVMFGEYIPLASIFPWVYDLSPLASGIEPGAPDQPPLVVGKYKLSASICFESTVPQRIRESVAYSRAAGQTPDVLVNLTNDAWFWGSAQLEQHLACNVFRAVECRKPLAVAANTGLSAAIDADGRRLWVGPKWGEDVHVAELPLDVRESPYLTIGDWPAALCVVVCLALGVLAWRRGAVSRTTPAGG